MTVFELIDKIAAAPPEIADATLAEIKKQGRNNEAIEAAFELAAIKRKATATEAATAI